MSRLTPYPLRKGRHAGQGGSRLPPAEDARPQISGDMPGGTSAPAFLPDAPRRIGVPCASVTDHLFPGKPGHNKAPWTIRQDHPGGKALRQEPTMQPNTVNTHHDTGPPVPPELLEAVARALAAALIPPPRAPAPPETEDTPRTS